MQVNVLQAKNQLSALIKQSLSGEDVVIANRGEPMVRLVPVIHNTDAHDTANEAPKFSTGAAILAWLAANPLPANVGRTDAQMEADIALERDAWE